jgi:gluconokinase
MVLEVTAAPILVVMGVAGTGKSTVAGMLAGRLHWELEEGDDLHPPANVAKMSAGIPLDDDDRWPWLDAIAAWIRNKGERSEPGIVTCSALKRSYRDRLRGPNVIFVFLSGSREVIEARLTSRLHHFMPPALLDSQLATLEPPDSDENMLEVSLGDTPDEEVAVVLRALEGRMESQPESVQGDQRDS